MAYYIFIKNLDNIEGSIYRIAENNSDLNNLNINQSDYKIIENNIQDFNDIKFFKKMPIKYINNDITFIDYEKPPLNDGNYFLNKTQLQQYITNFCNQIKQFLNNNSNHPLFSIWNNYYIQLNSLNLDIITFPLNKSLEQYFNDLGQTSLNPLQLP
jgi:hypothetical protein